MSALSPKLAAAAVLAQTVAMAALFAIVLTWFADDDPFDGTLRDFVLVAAIHVVDAALVVGVLLLGLGGMRLSALGWGSDFHPERSVALGLTGALLCASIVAGVGLTLGGLEGLRETVEGFLWMPAQQRMLCLLIGIGAAFVEETVFRGALQPVLTARLGRPLGIAGMAIVFSAYHLKFGLAGFVVKALFGGIFGTLREVTGRNWAPALAHMGVWVLVGFS